MFNFMYEKIKICRFFVSFIYSFSIKNGFDGLFHRFDVFKCLEEVKLKTSLLSQNFLSVEPANEVTVDRIY